MEKCFENLIFDIDGTLWNTTGVVASAWNRAVSESGIDELKGLTITAEMLQKEFGKPMDVIADDLFGEIDPVKKAGLLKVCCGYEHDAIQANTRDLTYPGMRDTLKKLSKNHGIYIVSNCQDGYIELVIAKNGLEGIVKDFECFGHTGLQKDENISLLIKRQHIEGSAVYIGDTMGDFVSTKKAGIPFVFAAYGFGDVPSPDYRINSISELLDL